MNLTFDIDDLSKNRKFCTEVVLENSVLYGSMNWEAFNKL